MVEKLYVGYLRRWPHGRLTMELQMQSIKAAVATNGGRIVKVFVEDQKGRWDWRKAERPALEEAIAYCDKHKTRLVSMHWGESLRDYKLNERIAYWNAFDMNPYLAAGLVEAAPETPKRILSKRASKRLNITKPHGFASPNRADAAESRIRGLQTQIEKRQAHFDDIKNVAELAVKLGFDTPQKLKAYLDESGVKTVTKKCWSRQAASNLLKRIKTDHS